MKLTFFLIGFCLLVLRFYYSYSGLHHDRNDYNMVMKGDNLYEEIRYNGKIELTDDEKKIKSISPGGYFKYIKNEKKLVAESNLKGEISYTFYDGGSKMQSDAEEKLLMEEAVDELLANGFDAEKRADLLFKTGGAQAVLKMIDSLRSDQAKLIYFDRVQAADSLSSSDLSILAKKVAANLNSDYDKSKILSKIGVARLKDSAVLSAYLDAVETMNSDMDREKVLSAAIDSNLIKTAVMPRFLKVSSNLNADANRARLYSRMIDKGIVQNKGQEAWLAAVQELNSDMDRKNLLIQFLSKDSLSGDIWVAFLESLNHINSDNDKESVLKLVIPKAIDSGFPFDKLLTAINSLNDEIGKRMLIKKLTESPAINEPGWAKILDAVSAMGDDNEKANLLIQIARKMPKTETIRAAYIKSAKTINSDSDFGRAIKEVE